MRIVAVAAVAFIVSGAGAVFVLNPFGSSVVDPETARCDQPPVTFGVKRSLADHEEVDVHFTCEGAIQVATIYLPKGSGRHPGLVWVHGAGDTRRIPYVFPLFSRLDQSGFAVLSYD